jgi:hypothetical protein
MKIRYEVRYNGTWMDEVFRYNNEEEAIKWAKNYKNNSFKNVRLVKIVEEEMEF